MLSGALRILNFDDSLIKQKRLLEQFHPTIINLTKFGPACRHWMDKKTAGKIGGFLDPELKNAITFLGSGDFHHVSSLLIEQFRSPLSVIIFDYHPDWDIMPPRLACGSWVNRILKMRNILKVILVGVSSSDISSFWVGSGNLNSLKDGRLEIYPYSHPPSKVLFRDVPENISVQVRRGLFYIDIHWQELKDKNLSDFFPQIIKRIPTQQVYISIDKDVLKSDYSLTNWEEGYFELDDLLIMLRIIKMRLDIVGLDITGDYSRMQLRNKIKAICANFDHPKNYTAKNKPETSIDSINEQTNISILESLKDPKSSAA